MTHHESVNVVFEVQQEHSLLVSYYPEHSIQSGRKTGRDSGECILILLGKDLRHKIRSKHIYEGTDIKVD